MIEESFQEGISRAKSNRDGVLVSFAKTHGHPQVLAASREARFRSRCWLEPEFAPGVSPPRQRKTAGFPG